MYHQDNEELDQEKEDVQRRFKLERGAKRCNENVASSEDQNQEDDEEIGPLCGSRDEEEEATPQVNSIDDFRESIGEGDKGVWEVRVEGGWEEIPV